MRAPSIPLVNCITKSNSSVTIAPLIAKPKYLIRITAVTKASNTYST